MNLTDKLKMTVVGLTALFSLAGTPQKSHADDFIVRGKLESVLDRSPINEGALELDGVPVPINSDGTFSTTYDGSGMISHSLEGYTDFEMPIFGNYGELDDSLIIQQFPNLNYGHSLFEIFDNMKFLGLPGGVWNRNWGFFEDPEYSAPIWFSPSLNNYTVTSLEYPDSTYSFMDVAKAVFLEPTREDSMFGHHIQDSGYGWHYEVPDSITNTSAYGVNLYVGDSNSTHRVGMMSSIEIATWLDYVGGWMGLDGVIKHEWMAHAVWFNDLPPYNSYNPSTICAGGQMEDFSEEDLDVLKVAHNLQNGTEMDWYTNIVGIPPLRLDPMGGRQIRFLNSPNPFNSTTVLNYSIDNPGNYDLDVFDIGGRKVREVFNGYHNPGNYSINFDGSHLSSGVYIARIMDDKGNSDVKKMSLIK
ncbi:MAG: T9SS type A sorting domain-containing protein [Nanoarchaeota archaeon]|nr:T9SS type A sorting domain-containing protein [Nanoarchaeota archaeon]